MSTDTMKIESTNIDLLTKEGWEQFLGERKDRARELSKDKDPEFVDTMLVLARHPETGKPPENSKYLLAHYFTMFNSPTDNDEEVEAQKDGYAMTLRSVGILGDAIASVWRSEAWSSVRTVPVGAKMPRLHMQPRHDPNRIEIISMMTDHRHFGSKGFIATITPDSIDPAKRTIGDWTATDVPTGRFASFLPFPGEPDDPVKRWAASQYLKMTTHLEKLWEHDPVAKAKAAP